MTQERLPAVAGMFYPADKSELHGIVSSYLEVEANDGKTNITPKAVIVPHAGYVYSGSVAASAYRYLLPIQSRIKRVVLLGPAHRLGFQGLALSSADYFTTPLGKIPLDQELMGQIISLPQVHVLDEAHVEEHSLEVHLPFLQEVLGSFTLIPIVVGEASPEDVAQVLEELWGRDETLIVISTDLSHYQDYDAARQRDQVTSKAIEELRYEDIGSGDACGRNPVNGLLYVARMKGLRIDNIDLRNSGDTAGPRDKVVGYGAYIVYEQ